MLAQKTSGKKKKGKKRTSQKKIYFFRKKNAKIFYLGRFQIESSGPTTHPKKTVTKFRLQRNKKEQPKNWMIYWIFSLKKWVGHTDRLERLAWRFYFCCSKRTNLGKKLKRYFNPKEFFPKKCPPYRKMEKENFNPNRIFKKKHQKYFNLNTNLSFQKRGFLFFSQPENKKSLTQTDPLKKTRNFTENFRYFFVNFTEFSQKISKKNHKKMK